jgi:predicted acylesterase/phospholipase RssA
MTGKSALVLAGGGLNGAVYEIGALCAIEDLLLDRTVSDFDIFVGTSAGAFVASLLANGINPREMLQGLDGSHPELPPIEHKHILNIDRRGLAQSALRFPARALAAGRYCLRNRKERTLVDLALNLSDALPSGIYDPLALEKYVRHLLSFPGLSNDFDELARELYIIATDLDSGERAVFGSGQMDEAPISLAVAASSAMPILYKPVRIGRHEYVDGGIRGNASLDLAIERGATLVVCINPIVPYADSRQPNERTNGAFLSDKGIKGVSGQTLAILLHSGLHYHIKQLRRRHPDVDIILIEPRADDRNLHFDNIMEYSARLRVAQHGFESVTLDLAQDYDLYRAILQRHGIPVSRRLLAEEMQEIINSNYDPAVIRRILHAKPPAARTPASALQTLTSTLDDLDRLLQELTSRHRDPVSANWQNNGQDPEIVVGALQPS